MSSVDCEIADMCMATYMPLAEWQLCVRGALTMPWYFEWERVVYVHHAHFPYRQSAFMVSFVGEAEACCRNAVVHLEQAVCYPFSVLARQSTCRNPLASSPPHCVAPYWAGHYCGCRDWRNVKAISSDGCQRCLTSEVDSGDILKR